MLSHVQLFATPWTSLSLGYSRQEYWSGLPFPSPGDLSHLGIKTTSSASPALVGGFFTTEPPGKPLSQMGKDKYCMIYDLSSVQFSCSVVSNSLRPRGLQHARPPCWSPLPEFTQTHVHWVGDAIQLSHPLPSPSFPTFNLSQHQSLFKWVSSLHQVTKVLEFQLQHQSFQWIFRTDFL